MTQKAATCGERDPANPKKTAATKVFETARDLFYRRGIRAVGVDEIVCEAGVTKPSLYRAFKSKDALVTACLRESAREARDALQETLASAGPEPRARLEAALRHFADKLGSPDYRGCPMSNVAVELSEPGAAGRDVVEACKSELRGVFLQLTRDLGASSPEVLADGLILVIEGAIATHHVFGSQGPAHSMLITCNALIDAHVGESARAKASVRR